MKLDLTNTRIDLAAAVMKLGEMNNELIKVKRDFTIKLEGNFYLTRNEFHQVIVMELYSHFRTFKHNRQKFGENEWRIGSCKKRFNPYDECIKRFSFIHLKIGKIFFKFQIKAFNCHPGTDQELNITKIELEKTKKTLNGIFFILLEY